MKHVQVSHLSIQKHYIESIYANCDLNILVVHILSSMTWKLSRISLMFTSFRARFESSWNNFSSSDTGSIATISASMMNEVISGVSWSMIITALMISGYYMKKVSFDQKNLRRLENLLWRSGKIVISLANSMNLSSLAVILEFGSKW